MDAYWKDLQLGGKPALPDYNAVLTVVENAKWSLVQDEVPNHYWDLIPKGSTGSTGTASTSDMSSNQSNASTTTNNTGTDRTGERSVRITNPSPDGEWNAKFKDDGRKISTLNSQGNMPKFRDDGVEKPVCLCWNLDGYCYSKCSKKKSHYCTVAGGDHVPIRRIPQGIKVKMDTYVATFGTNGENANQNE
mmetsp:Transcript_54389/g.132016  ORF Transcript_54389/g.132016 Transcript_54389/m.132016 type:complete len:191 (-) Transcript_54389:440-1012(-)|eukprot:CAMPEP_0113470938 /NCGR_PEP_ID=MMETSP0014_2-20120614/16714_1 /TAXON_ID=2857 /ORGANISM="Nitzschia sp." /LENGTH=190 /DNA_ID=CAMNT_0000363545 /DNA_START=469 /DNA_END=1041 /DNA_ORIENTATION=- /assembly_acc=CAM_ASM_000159